MSSFENPSRLLFVLDCLSVFGAYCGTYLRDSEGFKLHGKMEKHVESGRIGQGKIRVWKWVYSLPQKLLIGKIWGNENNDDSMLVRHWI